MDYIFVGIIGLLIGSFLNVCIYRIPRGESISFPPSHCTKCGTRIKWYDLFPVLSYMLLRGKCRTCGDKISIRYPLIELLNATLYMLVYIKYGPSIDFLKFALLSSILIVIGLIDLDTTDVYFKTTLTGIIIGIVFMIISFIQHESTLTFIYGAALSGGIIALIILTTHGMGWGDFEICLLCGLYLGLASSIVMLFLSFVIGGAVGAFLIVSGRKGRKDYIPFGPFIALGAVIAVFIGNDIINWYLSML
jgi:leader peptidase (prepilin peptidase)/N-methyltransferase